MNALLLKAGKWAIAAAVAALLLFLVSQCEGRRWQAKTDAALDSALVARTEANANAALAKEAESRADAAYFSKLVALERAWRALAVADRLRAARADIRPVASVPGTAPSVSDTLRATAAKLDNCEEETVSLRETIAQDSTALKKSNVTETELRGALALERVSVTRLTDSNADLSRQLASAAPPCRVLLWGCPSRTVVAIGSVVTTYLIVRR